MENPLINISTEFQNYNINKVEGGASKKKIFKLNNKNNNNSFILIDFVSDKKEYTNYLKIYNLLKDKNISIPKIVENHDNNLLIITEDFGNLRFDKIFEKYSIKDLLFYAVETLIILKNSIKFNKKILLETYNIDIFVKEISELTSYYLTYLNRANKKLSEEFIYIWKEEFKKINFEFNSFVHKDYNINNLILLPSRKKHLKCGVIDFQSAFYGESSWDLFSLLEDSRFLFTNKYNNKFNIVKQSYLKNKKIKSRTLLRINI